MVLTTIPISRDQGTDEGTTEMGRRGRAVATIFLHLSDDVKQTVRTIRDPVEFWKALSKLGEKGFTARYGL